MTIEELRKQYERFSEMCEKRGDEYYKQAQDLVVNGHSGLASRYYDKATSEYQKATIYRHFVNDLLKVTK